MAEPKLKGGKTIRSLLLAAFLWVSVVSQVVSAEATKDGASGLAGLLIVCQHLGVDTSLDELSQLAGEPTGGAPLGSLARAARAKGLQAAEVKVRLHDLAGLRVPAIALMWDDHCAAVETSGGETFKITRAGLEPQILSREDFGKMYSGLALLISQDKELLPATAAPGPDMRFARHTFNFGRAEEGTEVAHAFEFTNVGSTDLIIGKVDTTCGCTSAFVSANTIPSGGAGAVVATFDTSRRLGLQSYEVHVTRNDSVTPVVQLTISGVVMPRKVLVSPRAVEFHTIRKGETPTREVYLFDPGHTDIQVADVVSDSPLITARVDSIGTREEFPRYRVTLTLDASAPLGRLESKVTIHTNHPKEPEVEIPVSATIKAAVYFHPDLLFLGIVKKGQEGKGSIIVSTVGDRPLKIDKIDNPVGHVSVEIIPQVQGREYLITAILKDTAPTGTIKGEIVVYTNDLDEPRLRVPVCALVEEGR